MELKSIQTQQNQALKILFSKDYMTPTLELHKEIKILMMQDIYNVNIAKFVYKHQNNLLPTIFEPYFNNNNEIHQHNTRHCTQIHRKNHSKTSGQKTVKNKGAIIWNTLPKTNTKCKTIKNFSKKTKEFYTNKY
jgi:hypothetical protein